MPIVHTLLSAMLSRSSTRLPEFPHLSIFHIQAYALRTVIGKPFRYRLLSDSRKQSIVAFTVRCASILKKCQHLSAQKE